MYVYIFLSQLRTKSAAGLFPCSLLSDVRLGFWRCSFLLDYNKSACSKLSTDLVQVDCQDMSATYSKSANIKLKLF